MDSGNANAMNPWASRTDVDKGYAWVIVLASFSIQFLLTGYVRTSGVLFVEFQNQFHSSSTMTSLTLGVQEGSYSIVAFLFVGFVLKKTSPRFLCLFGSLFFFIGVTGNFFANGVSFLIFTHGACVGAALGMCYGTTMIVLSDYFVHRRALATCLVMTGASAGGSVIPMLTRYLLVEYGFYGGFLLFGGIVANTFVFSMLLFPAKNSVLTENTASIQHHVDVQYQDREIPEHPHICSLTFNSGEYNEESGSSNTETTNYFSAVPSGTLVSSNGKVSDVYQTSSESLHENLTVENHNLINDEISSSSKDGLLLSEDTGRFSGELRGSQKREEESADVASFESQASQQKTPDVLHCSSTSLHHSIEDPSNSLSTYLNQPRSRQRQCACLNACRKFFQDVYANPLLRSASFWMLPLFFMVSWPAYLVPLMFVPALVKDRGLTDDDGAFFASLLSILDLPARLVPGIIVNTGYLKATSVTVLPVTAVGVVGFFTPLMNTYNSLLVLVVVYGLFGGVYVAMQTLIVIDMVGLKYYPFVLALCYLTMSIGSSFFYPIAGQLKDVTGSFTTSYFMLSTMVLVSVVMLLCLPAIRRFDVRRKVLE